MNERIQNTRVRYVDSVRRIASSLELIAFDNAQFLDANDTSELIEIVTKLNRFIDKVATRHRLGSGQLHRLN